MRQLGIRSPGTMYPVLQTLRRNGFIHQVAQQGRTKLYALTEKGVREVKQSMVGLNRPYFTYHIDDYATGFVQQLQATITVTPGMRVLSTLNYQPYHAWLHQCDVTFLDVFESPPPS